MKKKLTHYFFIFVIVTFTFTSAYSQTHIGYVADVSGNWRLNNKGTLKHGQKLPPSAKISLTTKGKNSYIKIADLTGKIREYKKCSQPCSFQLPAAAAASTTSYFSTILSSVMDLVWGSPPERFSEHRSKRINLTDTTLNSRINTFNLSDGVLKLENGKIHLLQSNQMSDELSLKWRKVISGNKGKFGNWSERLMVKPEAGKIIIPFTGFITGLYEFCSADNIQTQTKTEDDSCQTNSAWIYVSSTENFEQVKKDFEQAALAIDSLTQPTFSADTGREIPGIDANTALLYLRIYLENLDKKLSGKEFKN